MDIGHPVLGTEDFEPGCGLLILTHAKIGPNVMFNLIVEPSMTKINQIVTGVIIDGTDDLPDIKAERNSPQRIENTAVLGVLTCLRTCESSA